MLLKTFGLALGLSITAPAFAQQPFQIITDGTSQPVTFSNFHMHRGFDRGIPTDELLFNVAVTQSCPAISLHYNVLSKSGTLLKNNVWHQRFSRAKVGDSYQGQIGDYNLDFADVGRVEVAGICEPYP